MTYKLLFTLDYEIHGNGDGNPQALMVEPTYRLMNLLEEYKQHLVIMADVAEILCFRRYREQTGRDDFHVAEIEEQLRDAVRRGHEVQLHIHSSYFRAEWDGKHFDQCIEDYNMAALPIERIRAMVGECVCYLEALLRPVRADYKVWLFRAANWSMMPTPALYQVLTEYGITHDTSVYKGGCQGGSVCYDYRTAYDNLLPYTASARNINDYDPAGAITELPIYTEMRPFYAFVSPIRLYRMLRAKLHRHKRPTGADTAMAAAAVPSAEKESVSSGMGIEKESASSVVGVETEGVSSVVGQKERQRIEQADNRRITLRSFFTRSPLKMDFNQLRSRQLIAMLRHIESRLATIESHPAANRTTTPPATAAGSKSSNPAGVAGSTGTNNAGAAGNNATEPIPVVLIGHSKTFIPYNETTLRPFLRWLTRHH